MQDLKRSYDQAGCEPNGDESAAQEELYERFKAIAQHEWSEEDRLDARIQEEFDREEDWTKKEAMVQNLRSEKLIRRELAIRTAEFRANIPGAVKRQRRAEDQRERTEPKHVIKDMSKIAPPDFAKQDFVVNGTYNHDKYVFFVVNAEMLKTKHHNHYHPYKWFPGMDRVAKELCYSLRGQKCWNSIGAWATSDDFMKSIVAKCPTDLRNRTAIQCHHG